MAKHLISLCLLWAVALHALPVGNPSEPVLLSSSDQMTLRVGYYNDTVGARTLVADDWSQEAKWMTNSAQLTLNVLGKIDLFATLGVAMLRTRPDALQTSVSADGNANACISIKTFPSAAYGYGLRATVLNLSGFYLGLEAQTVKASPRPFFSTAGKEGKHAEEKSMRFKEQQYGLAASYTIPTKILIIPYAGLRWCRVTLDFDELAPPEVVGGGSLRNLTGEKPWGTVMGAALIGSNRWSVALEGSLKNERAMSLMAQLKY